MQTLKRINYSKEFDKSNLCHIPQDELGLFSGISEHINFYWKTELERIRQSMLKGIGDIDNHNVVYLHSSLVQEKQYQSYKIIISDYMIKDKKPIALFTNSNLIDIEVSKYSIEKKNDSYLSKIELSITINGYNYIGYAGCIEFEDNKNWIKFGIE